MSGLDLGEAFMWGTIVGSASMFLILRWVGSGE